MWRRTGVGPSQPGRRVDATSSLTRPRFVRRPVLEKLEGRQLLTASLQPLPGLSVPAQVGYQVPLDGSGDLDPSQTYTVTSNNPNVGVSIAQGPFLTFTVSHNPAAGIPTDPTITHQTIIFQLFKDLTPQTASRVANLAGPSPDASWITAGYPTNYYNNKYISRIVGNFDGDPNGFVIEGGTPTNAFSDPGTGVPTIGVEAPQQLAYVQPYSLGMAHNASPSTNDAVWFVTTATPRALDYQYTIFGQMVAGQATINELKAVATTASEIIPVETSQPISTVVINSATVSATSVYGVIHVDTTSARPGDTANITVTATDPTDGSHVTRSFKITVGAYGGETDPPIDFKPLANPTTATARQGIATAVQLAGQSGYPDPSRPATLTYKLLTQPAHGTLSQFNPATGALVYTPAPGYSGADSFQYQVTSTGPQTSATLASLPGTVSITVNRLVLSPVTVTGVTDVLNATNQVTQIVIAFSAPVNASQAGSLATYRLAFAGAHGSYTASNAKVVTFRKPVYNASTYTVTLTPVKPITLISKAQLLVRGTAPSGLRDTLGHLLDGNHDGRAGGNAAAYLSASGVVLT